MCTAWVPNNASILLIHFTKLSNRGIFKPSLDVYYQRQQYRLGQANYKSMHLATT